MKGSKELKRYLSKWWKELKACHFDDMYLFKLQHHHNKSRYKRKKRISDNEF
ncbi:MAG: hypothetical protein ACXW2E_01775 [Nitrososphaeraceae archaeon]